MAAKGLSAVQTAGPTASSTQVRRSRTGRRSGETLVCRAIRLDLCPSGGGQRRTGYEIRTKRLFTPAQPRTAGLVSNVYLARFAESCLSDSSPLLATSVPKDGISTRIFVAKSVKSAINSGKNIKNHRLNGRPERISPDLSLISGQTIQEFH